MVLYGGCSPLVAGPAPSTTRPPPPAPPPPPSSPPAPRPPPASTLPLRRPPPAGTSRRRLTRVARQLRQGCKTGELTRRAAAGVAGGRGCGSSERAAPLT